MAHEPAAKALQRERLLDAMAATVARHGYPATTVALVLQRAGLPRRAFDAHFADAEDCLLAAYDAIEGRCTEAVRGAWARGGSPLERLGAAVDALLHVLATHPAYARLAVVEILAAGPCGLARRERTFERGAAALRSAGLSTTAPSPLVAQAVVGGIHRLLYARLIEPGEDGLSELAPTIVHFAVTLTAVRPTSG